MSFARILRSSALMGGAQVITLAMAFLRAKLIAVVFGPSGIGLMGVFSAFNGNVATIAGWGLGTSAVRTVAGAAAADRAKKTAAVRVLGRRLAWGGLIAVVLLAIPVGQVTFESQRYSLELLIAGLAVPCMVATGMWTSLLQAGGYIESMARTQASSSLLGLLVGLPFIYFFGTIGIALSILIASVATALITWRAANRFCPDVGASPTSLDFRELLQLGLIMQIGGVTGAIAAYLIRVLILRSHGDDLAAGLADAGYYQAALAITGSLPGVIFSATSSDFYPRVAAAKDEGEARRITEKQIQASLLLALPILMTLLTMGQLVVRLLYAQGFEPAVPLLDWFAWAIFLNLIGWPLGFWVAARRSPRTVAVFQGLYSAIVIFLALALVPILGVTGAAIATLFSSLAYTLILAGLSRRASGRWISYRVVGWITAGAASLFAARTFVDFAGNAYWGLLPTSVTTLICALIYIRIIASAAAEEISE